MSVDEILDMLDELLDKAWNLPLSGGRCVVDAERVRELIDDIRLNLPGEIKQAKAIVADRQEIITSARNEAAATVSRAEEKARAMVTNEEIYKQAQAKANELISAAQLNAREMRHAATEFAENLFRTSEEFLLTKVGEVKNIRQNLKGQRPAK